MACGCIKNTYNPHISVVGSEKVVYEDESFWMDDVGFDVPEEYDVEVTGPNEQKRNFTLKVAGRNVFSPSDLFSSNDVFLDGFYCFKVISCGKTYKAKRAILPNARCKLDRIFGTLARSACNDSEYQEYYRMEGLFEAVNTNIAHNNTKTAEGLWDVLEVKLRNYDCSSC